jgi:uncharacterized protein YyaL (SSP411 family)
MEECISQFYDASSGLFFFSSSEQKVLVTRKIDVNDDVIPSSNSILAHCLYKLAYYFNRADYEEKQERMLQAITPKMKKFPNGFSNWMQLIALREKGFTQVVITGIDAQKWIAILRNKFTYNSIFIEKVEGNKIPLLHEKTAINGQTLAWVCTDKMCGLPLTSTEQILLALNQQ